MKDVSIYKFDENNEPQSRIESPKADISNKEWKLNDVIIVKKNPYYWDKDTVSIKEIRFFASDNETSEDLRYRSGMLHYLNTIKVI